MASSKSGHWYEQAAPTSAERRQYTLDQPLGGNAHRRMDDGNMADSRRLARSATFAGCVALACAMSSIPLRPVAALEIEPCPMLVTSERERHQGSDCVAAATQVRRRNDSSPPTPDIDRSKGRLSAGLPNRLFTATSC